MTCALGARVRERVAKLHAVDRRLRDAVRFSAGVDAEQIENRRQDVDGVHVLVSRLAGRPSRAGQCTISGSQTPPSCVSRLKRLSGVLPAHAQPHG